MVKRETQVWYLVREDPLEKEMAIHSSTLAWKIPWMEEPDRLRSMGSQRVRHDWATSLTLTVHGVLKARILEWFAVPFYSGPHFVRTLHHDPSILGGHIGMAHSFTELGKAWSIWSDWSVFCNCGFQFVCPLMEEDKSLMEVPWRERITRKDKKPSSVTSTKK